VLQLFPHQDGDFPPEPEYALLDGAAVLYEAELAQSRQRESVNGDDPILLAMHPVAR
jgi:hypothetical protein